MLNRRSLLMSSVALPMIASATAHAANASSMISVQGITASVEIIDDPWGVPHIRAQNKPDAFFGQGYVVARDRLFQIDLAHRRRVGRLAEVFGEAFLDYDHTARLLLYRGDLDAELAAVPAEVRHCAEAYVAGVNARISELEKNPADLPLEYGILRIKPLRWDIREFVAGRGDDLGNLSEKVRRAQLAAMGLLELDELVAPLRPNTHITIPNGLDVAAVTEGDLGLLRNAGRALPFGTLAPASPSRVDIDSRGSNSWTVSGKRTATGRPILANDPHLGIGGFAPRHVAHLTAPGLDVMGGGEPGLPGIMQGHTDRFAFGRTNFHIDQEDVFILELDPKDPERYRHKGAWRRFDTVSEKIATSEGQTREVTLRFAAQGPVLSHDPQRNRAVAFTSVTLYPGASTFFAMVAMNLATDWTSLREAYKLHPSPTNSHYADVDGNTAWHAIGFVPIRSNHDGLMPVPGDGRYDWKGIRPTELLPSVFNPPQGWFASANQNNLPAGYPYAVSYAFSAPFRYNRIASVLSQQTHHSIADSIALQHDVVSDSARRLIALLPAQLSSASMPAANLLRAWDQRISGDSGAAALYEMLTDALQKRLLQQLVPDRARKLIESIDAEALLTILETPDRRLGPDPRSARDTIIESALIDAWSVANNEMGSDPSQWRWDRLHQVVIRHPLSEIPAIAAAFPPIQGAGTGGDNLTVMARWNRAGKHYQVAGGASYLMVVDVGAWDNSVMLNLPGQSADPGSPHYSDYYAPWVAAAMQPMLFSKQRIDAHAINRTTLLSNA